MGVPEEDIPKYIGAGAGWLRSPRNNTGRGGDAFTVYFGMYGGFNVDNGERGGVVPALQIQL